MLGPRQRQSRRLGLAQRRVSSVGRAAAQAQGQQTQGRGGAARLLCRLGSRRTSVREGRSRPADVRLSVNSGFLSLHTLVKLNSRVGTHPTLDPICRLGSPLALVPAERRRRPARLAFVKGHRRALVPRKARSRTVQPQTGHPATRRVHGSPTSRLAQGPGRLARLLLGGTTARE